MNKDLYITRLEMYGIRIYNNNEVIYEEKSNDIMSNESIKKVRIFYDSVVLNKLNNINNIKYKIYTKCRSENDNFMIWFNISLEDFKRKCNY
jgi:hypothetical protein